MAPPPALGSFDAMAELVEEVIIQCRVNPHKSCIGEESRCRDSFGFTFSALGDFKHHGSITLCPVAARLWFP